MLNLIDFFRNYDVIILDFDGVIKESIEIKNNAFYEVFLPYGSDFAAKALSYHINNMGVSRFEKFNVYARWLSEEGLDFDANLLSRQFAKVVVEQVVSCPYVAGFLDFINSPLLNAAFYIASATPQEELERILLALNISEFFSASYGFPSKKHDIINFVCESKPSSKYIFVGDSMSDYNACAGTPADFVLRISDHNLKLKSLNLAPFFYDYHGQIFAT
jgi:phosphoglycolate phosphatase-like HAD superfamily hydrolase